MPAQRRRRYRGRNPTGHFALSQLRADDRGASYVMPPIPPYRFWLQGDRLCELQAHLDRFPDRQPSDVLKGDDALEYFRLRGKADLFWFAKHCMGFTWLRWDLHGPLAYAWSVPDGTLWIPRGEDEATAIKRYYRRFRAAVIPRGHLKTSLLTQAFATWRVVKNPEERILIYTMTYDFASVIFNYIKTTLEGGGHTGEFFLSLYGDIVPSPADRETWGKNDLTVKRQGAYSDPTFKCRGIGSRVTGGHHTLQLVDDLVGEELDRTQMAKVLRDFNNLDPLYHSLALGERRFVGTPWAFFDPVSYISNPRKFPFGTVVARMSWRQPNGELIFPPIEDHPELGGCDLEEATRIRERDEWFFSCQYECWPKSENAIGFDKDWFRYFRQRGDYFYELDRDDKEIRRIAINECNTFMFLDPNTGREEGGRSANMDANMPVKSSHDFAAWVVVCVDKDNRWFIPRVLRWRCNIDDLVDRTFEMVATWKPIKVCIEQRGAQIFLRKIFQDAFNMGRDPFVIDEWEGGNATKPSRIKGLIPFYANGRVFHRSSENKHVARQMLELETELLEFPTPEHDDASDALSAAVKKVYAPGQHVASEIRHEKRNVARDAQLASLDNASRRLALSWFNRKNEDGPDEMFAEG